MAHQRIHHLKMLCGLALLSFISRRLAGLAAVPVLYGIWNTEMERLLVGRKSEYKHPKRGKGLRAGKVEPAKQPPGMGMGYLYRPGEQRDFSSAFQRLTRSCQSKSPTMPEASTHSWKPPCSPIHRFS